MHQRPHTKESLSSKRGRHAHVMHSTQHTAQEEEHKRISPVEDNRKRST
jgi:hypothetical protein